MENPVGRGRGRGRDKGQGRGKGRYGEERHNKSQIQCYYCKKFRHIEANCWSKQKDENNQSSFANKIDEESNLFMVLLCDNKVPEDVWLLDSRCSNHMMVQDYCSKSLMSPKIRSEAWR